MALSTCSAHWLSAGDQSADRAIRRPLTTQNAGDQKRMKAFSFVSQGMAFLRSLCLAHVTKRVFALRERSTTYYSTVTINTFLFSRPQACFETRSECPAEKQQPAGRELLELYVLVCCFGLSPSIIAAEKVNKKTDPFHLLTIY